VKKLSEKFSINFIFLNTLFKKIKILEIKSSYTHFEKSNIKFLELFYKFRQLQKILKF
jgi:hypothetical protein